MTSKKQNQILEKKYKNPNQIEIEIEKFKKRNAVEKGECCDRCLKAYLMKNGLGENLMKGVEVGHLGYYMDEEELIKV